MSFVEDTKSHQIKVRRNIASFIEQLTKRSLLHDESKLASPEKELLEKFSKDIKHLVYGSEEYAKSLEEQRPALEHHYANNSHHPEHYGSLECNVCFKLFPMGYSKNCNVCGCGQFTQRPDIGKMTLVDLMEMLADWKAASERVRDGSMERSLQVGKSRFNISGQLMSVLENTARAEGWL